MTACEHVRRVARSRDHRHGVLGYTPKRLNLLCPSLRRRPRPRFLRLIRRRSTYADVAASSSSSRSSSTSAPPAPEADPPTRRRAVLCRLSPQARQQWHRSTSSLDVAMNSVAVLGDGEGEIMCIATSVFACLLIRRPPLSPSRGTEGILDGGHWPCSKGRD
uniref:Uncharacterized protein n=1 Tax=Oryza glumipatula TaxID=40148 RepID=A0A0E0AGH9_9ORYZ